MRKPLLLLIALSATFAAQAREVVDMAGRKVAVPDKIERVFGAAPPINVLLNVVAPETMVGLSFAIPEDAAPYHQRRLLDLPVAGGIFGMGRQTNPETVLNLRPDVALVWKSSYIQANKVEEDFARLGVPMLYVRLEGLADWPAALRFGGRLLGHDKEAEAQAVYVEQTLARMARIVAAVPEAKRPRVYYAESPDGLATDCHRSFHTEAIELAGGYNVHRCEPKDHSGMERVSLEQVLAYDPEVILTHDRSFAKAVRQDPRWQGIRAVRDGRIHVAPRWPHNWIDRPPSVMRVLGIQWLASLFYPKAGIDLRRETQGFYRQFLGVELTDARYAALFD